MRLNPNGPSIAEAELWARLADHRLVDATVVPYDAGCIGLGVCRSLVFINSKERHAAVVLMPVDTRANTLEDTLPDAMRAAWYQQVDETVSDALPNRRGTAWLTPRRLDWWSVVFWPNEPACMTRWVTPGQRGGEVAITETFTSDVFADDPNSAERVHQEWSFAWRGPAQPDPEPEEDRMDDASEWPF